MQPNENKAAKRDDLTYTNWWKQLSGEWKQAFNEGLFQKKSTEMPAVEQLKGIFDLTVLRLAGPDAMFPNVSVSLTDLSGVSELVNLELLVVVNHHIRSLRPLSNLKKLNALFVFSNHIDSLKGIDKLTGLKQLYFNDNRIDSLDRLSDLVNLETLHCAHNKLTSLSGIGKQHTSLKDFFCLPNDGIWSSEIMRFENEYRIRCQKG